MTENKLETTPVTDLRYQALQTGLDQLGVEDLTRLDNYLKAGGSIVLDTYNYDAETQTWCPLAVGLGLHETEPPTGLTDIIAKKLIVATGKEKYGSFSLNPISGVEGKFFTDDRRKDLESLVAHMVVQREIANMSKL